MLGICHYLFTREKLISCFCCCFICSFVCFGGICSNETEIINLHKRKEHIHIKAYIGTAYKLQCTRSCSQERLLYCSRSTNLSCHLRNILGWISRLVSLTNAKSTVGLLPGKEPGILTYETQFTYLKNRHKIFYF